MIRAALLALALVLSTPALAQEPTDDNHHDGEHSEDHVHDDGEDHGQTDEHVAQADGLRALHAWTNATTGSVALVYVEIENLSDSEIMLIGAETDIAATVSLVGLQNANGELSYAPIPQMPISAQSEVALAPNGLAIQVTGLTQPLIEGDTFQIEFDFEHTHLETVVAVEAQNATQHSHAGHNH